MTGNHILGYARVYRSLMDKGWYMDSEYVHLWVHLILKANHKGVEILHNGNIVKLKPGQFITGRKKLSAETGIEQSKIERILKLFEREKQIEQQTNKQNRVISILSWELYQNNEQQMNNERTTSEQRVNTDNNDNNDNNEKKINISFDDFWDEYDKKVGVKTKLESKWKKLTDKERELIMQYIPKYKLSQPDKKYRQDPETFFNKKKWNDEIVGLNGDAEKKKYEVAGSRQILLLLPDEYENHPNKQNLYPTK